MCRVSVRSAPLRRAPLVAAGLVLAALFAPPLLVAPAMAAPTSTELFFNTPYLSKVPPGSALTYAYKHTTARPELGASFDETLRLNVAASPEKPEQRITDLDIDRAGHKSEAGPFPTLNGNPVSLVLLERDVKEMAQLSKGSPFYLRNRVRDALGNGRVEEARFEYDGRQVAGWKLILTPFAQDPNKDKLAELAGRRYEFLFSDEVPGGLYAIDVVTPKLDGSAPLIETSLKLTGASAPATTK